MTKTKRYNLVLPMEQYEAVEKIAKERHTTFAEMLRQFIRLGLYAVQAEDTDTVLLIRQGETERQVFLL